MSETPKARDQILDAAAEILETGGLKHLNTNAIAASAGVTPPTVYRYFDNKEAVVIALAHRFSEAESQWLSSATDDIQATASAAEVITLLIDAYWSAAQKQRGIVALRGAMRVWPELQAVEESSLANSSELVAQALSERGTGATHGELRRISRHIVELVCATVDRCYALPDKEKRWRIRELKTSITSYATARMT